jgi:cytochrome P450
MSLPVKRGCPFDPPAEYRILAEGDGITPFTFPLGPRSTNGLLVTRLSDVRAILADRRFSHRADEVALAVPPPFPLEAYAPDPPAPGAFNKMDPPEHLRYRKLLTRHFTLRRCRELIPVAEAIAAELLDAMAAHGPAAELVADYAEPLATRLMCALVGVPEEDRGELLHHLTVVARMHYTLDELIDAVTVIGGILDRLVTGARTAPDGTILHALAHTDGLDHQEIVNLVWALVGGGFDTTTNMLALGTFALLAHPAELDLLRGDPDLWSNAIEELLRYLTVSHLGASRAALEDVPIGAHTVARGETVVMALPAANRDPAHFPDPDRFDVTRNTRGHVAFGHGVHQCIGQHIARVIMSTGFRALFDRFPALHLAVDADRVPLREDMLHYGVHRLPLRLF